MYKIAQKIFSSLMIITFSAPAALAQNKLSVSVKNIKENKGTINMGLFNNANSFPNKGKPYKNVTVKVTGNVTTYTFTDLPTGDYAIALFHDENNDKKCNFTFGIPTEGFGFSNNVKIKLSPPAFSQARFALNGDKKISIDLNHF